MLITHALSVLVDWRSCEYLYNMNLKKIIREEIDDLQWMMEDWIDGEQLLELLLQTGAETIPFREVLGDSNLIGTQIKDLGNLEKVGGGLYLYESKIKDLGNLQSVGGSLDLEGTQIKDLGNLQSVGGDLYLKGTPISKTHSKEEIRTMVRVEGNIYL